MPWTVPRDWPGCTAVILAGGPSVLTQDLSLLRGRRVIAINSAWKVYPEADVLFFADSRWWRQFKPKFGGLVVTTSDIGNDGIRQLRKVDPKRLSDDPSCLALRRSSVTGAINLAVHFGSGKIVLLGVDGKLTNGVRHHHDDKYPWPMVDKCFDEHAAEFACVAPSIPVPVINANPDSAITVWPRMALEQSL